MRSRAMGYVAAVGIAPLLSLSASMPAHAQALPGWKIADICAVESTPGQCAAFEGRAQKAVSASWPFLLEPIRETCLKQAVAPPDQSWRLLAECLDNAATKAIDKAAVLTAHTPAPPVPPPRPTMPPLAADLAPPPAEAAAPAPPAAGAPKPQ